MTQCTLLMSHRGRILQDTRSMSISNDYLEVTSLPSCGPSSTSVLPPFSTLIMRPREPPQLLSPCDKTFKCSFLRKNCTKVSYGGNISYNMRARIPSYECGWRPAGQIHGSYQFQLAFESQPTRSRTDKRSSFIVTHLLHTVRLTLTCTPR